jgi:hypothetical protein
VSGHRNFLAMREDTSSMVNSEPSIVEDDKLNYPVILKTNVACSSTACHEFVLLRSPGVLEFEIERVAPANSDSTRDMDDKTTAYILMNYHSHGGVIIKSYKFGATVFYDVGAGLNEVAIMDRTNSRLVLEGNYKSKPANFKEIKAAYISKYDIMSESFKGLIEWITNSIAAKFGLECIGCDFIITKGTGENLYELMIIDVNYFSSGSCNENIRQVFAEMALKNVLEFRGLGVKG